jgi:surface antigen
MTRLPRAALAAVALATLALGACTPRDPVTGRAFLPGSRALAGDPAGTTIVADPSKPTTIGEQMLALRTANRPYFGGLAGSELGARLDERSLADAFRAQFEALQDPRSYVHHSWRNGIDGTEGSVLAGPTYLTGYGQCREYTHAIYFEGRNPTITASACRTPGGAWRTVAP